MSIGSFLGGIFVDTYGIRGSFRAFGIVALAGGLLCSLVTRLNLIRTKATGGTESVIHFFMPSQYVTGGLLMRVFRYLQRSYIVVSLPNRADAFVAILPH